MNNDMESKKRDYEPLVIETMTLSCGRPLLAASIIVDGTRVESVGHELGSTFNFSSENGIDSNTGKTFSHEWESGSVN